LWLGAGAFMEEQQKNGAAFSAWAPKRGFERQTGALLFFRGAFPCATNHSGQDRGNQRDC
jgi:hypothetical protein